MHNVPVSTEILGNTRITREPVAFHRGPVLVLDFWHKKYSYRRTARNYEYMVILEYFHDLFKSAGIKTVHDNKIAFEVLVGAKNKPDKRMMYYGFSNYTIYMGFYLIHL